MSTDTGTTPAEGFERALNALVAHMQATTDAYMAAHTYNWRVTLSTEQGPRYVRIVKQEQSSRSVMGFVRRSDGAILYAAGWKGPYLKGNSVVRGSIYDAATWMKCIDWHGVRTVR